MFVKFSKAKLFAFLEQVFLVLGIFYHFGGFFYVSNKPLTFMVTDFVESTDLIESSTQDKWLVLFIYSVTFLLLLVHWRKALAVAKRFPVIWVLVGFALASNLWTLSPHLTRPRTIRLLGTTLFGLYFALRHNLNQQLTLLGFAYGIAALLSIVFAIGLPSYGLMPPSGSWSDEWRGIFSHKNVLGKAMSTSCIVFLVLCRSKRPKKFYFYFLLSFSFLVLLLSNSITSLITFLCLFLSFFILSILKLRSHFIVIVSCSTTLCLGSTFLWLFSNAERMAASFGRDLTLTGRTDLWNLVLYSIQERPILGYGYRAFWDGEYGPSSLIFQLSGWNPPDAHNGFLDLGLSLGIFAILIFAIGWLACFARSITWLSRSKHAEDLWPGVFFLGLVLNNLTETSLMQGDIFWLLFVTLSLTLFRKPDNQSIY